jgi:hypothetical protein
MVMCFEPIRLAQLTAIFYPRSFTFAPPCIQGLLEQPWAAHEEPGLKKIAPGNAFDGVGIIRFPPLRPLFAPVIPFRR